MDKDVARVAFEGGSTESQARLKRTECGIIFRGNIPWRTRTLPNVICFHSIYRFISIVATSLASCGIQSRWLLSKATVKIMIIVMSKR
jgi:hypothetical protein